jgi:hypothetical protein
MQLRAEIAFWRSTQRAANHAAAYAAEAHPTIEQIVEYGRGESSETMKRIQLERHLQECASCREDYDIVKQAFASNDKTKAPQMTFGWLRTFAGAMLTPVYSIPTLAVLVLCVLLVKDRFAGPAARPIDFVLAYHSQERSVESIAMPAVQISKDVSEVHLSVHIPHALVQPERNSLILFSPDSRGSSLLEGGEWSQGVHDFDTARVRVPVSHLSGAGTYTLLVSITYAGTSRAFEYSYRFRVEVAD